MTFDSDTGKWQYVPCHVVLTIPRGTLGT